MPAIESLPPEQRAVLSLVLKQGKTYAEIATLLGIDETAVRERAHAALGALGPSEGTPPPPQRRAAVSDYLLGQQPDDDARRTREYLASSASGRAWARVVAGALRPLGDGAVPEIPSSAALSSPPSPAQAATEAKAPAPTATPEPSQVAPAAAAPAAPARGLRTARSSRRAGAALLAVVGAGLIALIVVLVTGGSSKHKPAARLTSTTSTTPQIVGQINLTSPSGGRGTIGFGLLVAQGNQLALELQAQGLPPTSRSFAYGVWLYNSHTSAEAVGSAPPVGKNGRLSAIAALPANTANYRALIVTRETNSRPTRPGPIVLSGPLPGH
jgi:Sigma-70, region 4